MPVQIPQLQRMNPEQPTSVGRIEANVPDGTKMVAGNVAATSGLVNEVDDYYEKVANHAAHTTALTAGSDFETWYKTSAARIKATEKGDPTEAYNNLEEEAKTKKAELIEQYGGDAKTKGAVSQRMDFIHRSNRDNIAVTREGMYGKFQDSENEKGITLSQNRLVDAAAMVDKNQTDKSKPGGDSFQKLRDQVADIENINVRYGMSRGLAHIDADGNPVYSNTLVQKMKNDVSNGLKNVIDTLNASGKTDEAEMIMEEYKDKINDKTKAQLVTGHKSAIEDVKASTAMASVKYLPPDEAMARLDRMPLDNKVKEKAKAKLHTEIVEKQSAKDIAGKQMTDDMSKYISKQGFKTVDGMMSDRIVKAAVDSGKMTVKQVEGLKGQVVAPAYSDEKAKARFQQALLDGKLDGMSPGELNEIKQGLNTSDRNKVDSVWQKRNDPSQTEQKGMLGNMTKDLHDQALQAGLIRGRTSSKLADQKILIGLHDEMLDQIDKFPPGTSLIEQHKWVKERVLNKAKTGVFAGSSEPEKMESSATPAPSAAPAATPAPNETIKKAAAATPETMSDADVAKWTVKFKQDNPKEKLTSLKQLRDYINKQGK